MKPEVLSTTRLYLRKLDPETFDHIFQKKSDAEQMLLLGLSSADELMLEKQKYEAGMWTYNRKFLYFQLIDKTTEEIIGWSGFHTWYTDHRRAELGYGLFTESYKRKGLMTEAVAAVIAYGFEKMKLHRIEAFVGPDNTASIRLMEKMNFVKEGCFREHYCKNGQMEDSLAYSLLQKEYQKK